MNNTDSKKEIRKFSDHKQLKKSSSHYKTGNIHLTKNINYELNNQFEAQNNKNNKKTPDQKIIKNIIKVASPKNYDSNFLNFTKRSVNIKQILVYSQLNYSARNKITFNNSVKSNFDISGKEIRNSSNISNKKNKGELKISYEMEKDFNLKSNLVLNSIKNKNEEPTNPILKLQGNKSNFFSEKKLFKREIQTIDKKPKVENSEFDFRNQIKMHNKEKILNQHKPSGTLTKIVKQNKENKPKIKEKNLTMEIKNKNNKNITESLNSNRMRLKKNNYINKENTRFKYSNQLLSPRNATIENEEIKTERFIKNTQNLSRNKNTNPNPENKKFRSDPKIHIENTITKIEKGIATHLALSMFNSQLTDYEKEELKFIDCIYYFGRIFEENRDLNEKQRKSNGGSDIFDMRIFDDEEGNYKAKKGDHINYRYEVIQEIGKGSFGQAFKCFDHKNKKVVCIKMINSQDQFRNQSEIEIKILEYIKKNDINRISNVVEILDSFMFRNHKSISFELLGQNLYQLLKENDFCGLESSLIKSYAFQLLTTISFLQNHDIIHCDLKPENILLEENTQMKIKVIDFGSSCFDKEKLYSYIQSRYYRAPEIILGLGYNPQIDMWSFGCILCEMFLGIPIFPGENEFDQLNLMMEALGVPPNYIILSAKKKLKFFDNEQNPLSKPNSKGKLRTPNSKPILESMKGADKGLLDLIEKCLVWDPFNRLTPEEGLKHKWFQENEKEIKIQNQRLLFDREKKMSNFLKYKGQVNKMEDVKLSRNLFKSNYSHEETIGNHTK